MELPQKDEALEILQQSSDQTGAVVQLCIGVCVVRIGRTESQPNTFLWAGTTTL